MILENAGMVTYGQTIIQAKPATDSEERRRLYSLLSAHELAHQWFGNLVTMGWWNDIWLNEAFATWISNKLIAEWKPEWGTRSENVKDTLRAEGRDSLMSSRMIRQEIESKDDITNAFDDITYQKGAAVIGMFENWMGPESFRSGVQNYMERYAFRTATTADFLDSLSTASRKDVTQAFSTFLKQSGLPIVSVSLHCQQGNPKLHLEQQRYLPLGSKSGGTQVWSIPVCVRYGTGTLGQNACALMTQPVMDMALDTGSCPAWVQGNDKAAGYYRLDYKSGLLDKLTDGKVDDRLSAPERVDLIGNARALVESGRLPEADALGLVAKFHADPERHVVQAALDLAMSPPKHLVPENLMAKYAVFIRANFQSRAHELGWTPNAGESDEVRLLRPELLSAVATYGEDQALAKTASAMADEWLKTHKGIDPSVIRDVLITAAYYGDESLARRFIAQWKQSDSQEQFSLFFAMAKFRDRKALRTVFEAVLSGELPATPSSSLYFFAGEDSPSTRDMRFEFLKAHFDQIVGILPDDPFGSASHLPTVGEGFCDTQAKNELKSYFEPRLDKLIGAPRTLAQVLEGINQCIEIKALQQPSVVAFLQGN